MWGATHSERNFREPYSFIPERWLDKENSTDKFGASNAFSLGPRGCIGRKYVFFRLAVPSTLSPSLSFCSMNGGSALVVPERGRVTRLLHYWKFTYLRRSLKRVGRR